MEDIIVSEPHASDDVDGIIAQMKAEWTTYHDLKLSKGRKGFPYPKDSPKVWIKWGYFADQLVPEAKTQDFIHESLKNLEESARNGVCVPEVFRFLEMELDDRNWPVGLIVMEYVPGLSMTSILQERRGSDNNSLYLNRIFDAVKTFLTFEPEEDTAPGPEGGGRIEHFIFGIDDSTAHRDFKSLDDLQHWVNEEVQKSPHCTDMQPVDFTPEGLKLCYCDLSLNNFIMPDASNPSNPIYVIDFKRASWLPFSFLMWEVLYKMYDDRQQNILKESGFKPSEENMDALWKLGYTLHWNESRRGY